MARRFPRRDLHFCSKQGERQICSLPPVQFRNTDALSRSDSCAVSLLNENFDGILDTCSFKPVTNWNVFQVSTQYLNPYRVNIPCWVLHSFLVIITILNPRSRPQRNIIFPNSTQLTYLQPTSSSEYVISLSHNLDVEWACAGSIPRRNVLKAGHNTIKIPATCQISTPFQTLRNLTESSG